jgi:5-(carboxyamino)imidazole ribonucleotide synthase
MSSAKIIEPGSTIGIFGGGQLGRMLVQVAARCGYRVIVFTPEIDSPAGQIAHETIQADYDDPDAVKRFAQAADVITLEFENISLAAVARAAEYAPVRPGAGVLQVAQHRIREKSTLAKHGFPVTPFVPIYSADDLVEAGRQLGWPMVLKTAAWGYDGKGQRKVNDLAQAKDAHQMLGPEEIIAEKMIAFEREVSILVARNPNGEIKIYPLIENEHSNHILDVSRCPLTDQNGRLGRAAEEIARGVVQSLDCHGLLCIEFFVIGEDELLINEIAPRPHNSGHLTMEACRTSQFEQQLRAVCNLPLGATELIQSAAMANLLGDVWNQGTPRFELAMREERTFLHLYGKAEARPGRKMGHITCLDQDPEIAVQRVVNIRQSLSGRRALFE